VHKVIITTFNPRLLLPYGVHNRNYADLQTQLVNLALQTHLYLASGDFLDLRVWNKVAVELQGT
jgi:hypothetical protein